MAKRVERRELWLEVATVWTVFFSVGAYMIFQIVTTTPADVTPRQMALWLLQGGSIGLYVWAVWAMWGYRSYAKRMLPLVNGCPNHPSYQGRSDVKGYSCPTCAAIRYSRLSLFPEERRS